MEHNDQFSDDDILKCVEKYKDLYEKWMNFFDFWWKGLDDYIETAMYARSTKMRNELKILKEENDRLKKKCSEETQQKTD